MEQWQSQLAAELADHFDSTRAEFASMVARLTPEQWARECGAEGWTVGVLVDHIGMGYSWASRLVRSVAEGGPIWWTWEAIDENNAQHAKERLYCTRAEALERLGREGEAASRLIRSLSDEQLARTEPAPVFGGMLTSVAHLIELTLIGHRYMHQESLEATLHGDGGTGISLAAERGGVR